VDDHREDLQDDHREDLAVVVDLLAQAITLVVMAFQTEFVILNVEKIQLPVLLIVGQRPSHDTMNSVMMGLIV